MHSVWRIQLDCFNMKYEFIENITIIVLITAKLKLGKILSKICLDFYR